VHFSIAIDNTLPATVFTTPSIRPAQGAYDFESSHCCSSQSNNKQNASLWSALMKGVVLVSVSLSQVLL